MFSQESKAAKLAWLESDHSKPAGGQQLGRNLFDLRSDTRPTPAVHERSKTGEQQHQHSLQSRPAAGRHESHQALLGPSQRTHAAGPASQASFITNTNTSEDELDAPAGAGKKSASLRQLQKKKRLDSLAARTRWPPAGSSPASFNCEDRPGARARRKSPLDRLCVCLWRLTCGMGVFLALSLAVYFWPVDSRYEFEPRVAPARPRPRFTGPLAVNAHLDEFGEKLFENQFHAPESMAWTADRRAFYTGVEGGFILLVEPYADRWTVAAKLNGRRTVEDHSRRVQFVGEAQGGAGALEPAGSEQQPALAYCERDVQLYGPRAEFEPSRVKLSRCSRPLGVRLAPDGSRLYVSDPLTGLYRVELAANLSAALADRARPLHALNRVARLVDFARPRADQPAEARPELPEQVFFGDDIAVHFGDTPTSDVVYLTDCSRRWSLRYLFWLMLENDDTGRVLRYDVGARQLAVLTDVLPVRLSGPHLLDVRGLSFPNGLELTADRSGLLVSDLNNRRILRHHLSGPRAGSTELVMWVPGYSDNIRRGLDLADGTPTYWFGCGCAVSDGKYEIAELFNELPAGKRLLLRWLHLIGAALDSLGRLTGSTALQDAGLIVDAAWFTVDPYCTHGLVAQFTEDGRVLRSLHGPGFGSSFKLISEAHQVPMVEAGANASAPDNNKSLLYLGSVYYPFLGRLDLSRPELALAGPAAGERAGASEPIELL